MQHQYPVQRPATAQRPSVSIDVLAFTSAKNLPGDVMEWLQANEMTANVILPMVDKLLTLKTQPVPQLWLVCITKSREIGVKPRIDFVLSCTEGQMGKYPIFIVSSRRATNIRADFLGPRMLALAETLHNMVPETRVFSVFAVKPVAQEFTQKWSQISNIACEAKPYYDATMGICTRETFNLNPRPIPNQNGPRCTPRKANEGDLMVVAKMCKDFASTSEPFTLTKDQAIAEAKILIKSGQTWLLEVAHPGEPSVVACIVCVTRSSQNVATITKVYTIPEARGHKCAQRLVLFVTHELLAKKLAVVLYAARDNIAARTAYDRVGFIGLGTRGPYIEDAEDWLEIGFDRAAVELGHW